jgi:lysophospholipase L1-like esterase
MFGDMSIRLPLIAVALAAVLLVPAAAAQAKAKPAPQLYVSLGDSYATGFMPKPVKANTKHGFVNQVPGFAKKRGYNLKTVNFGCAGATTSSLLNQIGCAKRALALGAAGYPKKTQIAAATSYIKAHRKNVKLITVSISGNDVTKCAKVAIAEVGNCVSDALTGINKNLSKTVKALRAAAGSKVKIVGITYPDVILGGWVRPGGKALAEPSVTVFKNLINPALKKQYESVKGSFVDVTAATGAYTPLSQTTTLAPYGVIPKAVAKVCELTWYCEVGDIHSKTKGYGVIAGLVAKELPKIKR